MLHSRLRAGERHDEWRRLREGEARICVGPRSAVFAPIGSLGLIVIDEEHDASYKHEGDPRYDAREVAAERAERAGALLLRAAPPAAGERPPRLPASRLARRVDGRPLPHRARCSTCAAQPHGLHPPTVAALAEVRERAGKAIVLLNRRGWSNFLSCRSCGRVWGCPECDVALVLHRARGHVACHHCGHRERCPSAARTAARARWRATAPGPSGSPTTSRARCDDGVPGLPPGRRRHRSGERSPTPAPARCWADFQAARAGVLIGTQMVAKGHDFADVALGVVLDADATLRFPDFRAEERTFALIAQLAGRAGRGGEGSVLVQTIAPEARAIAHAAHHDSDGFIAGELDAPPRARLPAVLAPDQDHRARPERPPRPAPRGAAERLIARSAARGAGRGARSGSPVPAARPRAPGAAC